MGCRCRITLRSLCRGSQGQSSCTWWMPRARRCRACHFAPPGCGRAPTVGSYRTIGSGVAELRETRIGKCSRMRAALSTIRSTWGQRRSNYQIGSAYHGQPGDMQITGSLDVKTQIIVKPRAAGGPPAAAAHRQLRRLPKIAAASPDADDPGSGRQSGYKFPPDPFHSTGNAQ